jgi:hypothetical protein
MEGDRRGPGRDLADEDLLVREAGRLEADGGCPGSGEARLLKSLGLLGLFLARGSGLHNGPFRPHVQRLARFVRTQLDVMTVADYRRLAERFLAHLESDPPPRLVRVDMCRALLQLSERRLTYREGWGMLEVILATVHPA